MDMTGCNAKKYNLDSRADECENGVMFKRLVRFSERGYLIGCASRGGSDRNTSALGIVQCHAYSILRVGAFDGHQLLLLRNPWGSRDWKGKFSDTDHESWTPSLVEQVRATPAHACPPTPLYCRG